MRNHFLKIGIVLAAAALFHNCAQVVPLNGGKRDTTPPKLVQASPSLLSTGFSAGEILLKFDERIQLKDLKNQLIISPRLKTEPELEAEGKNLRILIKKEELQPNTTYRIFFGKALADLHEGNVLPDFEYVFSTGPHIDSLKIQGKVSDAFSLAALQDVLVGLYESPAPGQDSSVFKIPPDYVSKSDNGGLFSFRYLPARTFSVVAFTDKNKNQVFDTESEKIGFVSEALGLTRDTLQPVFLFSEEPKKTFIRKSTSPYYGKALVIFNRKCRFRTRTQDPALLPYLYIPKSGSEKDTLTIYYRHVRDSLTLLIENDCSAKTDTLKLALPGFKLNNKKTLTLNTNLQNGVLPWNRPLQLSFFNLLDTTAAKPDKMTLIYKKDTLMVREELKAVFPEPFTMEIQNKLSEGVDYRIESDTAVLYDHNGRYNDSIRIPFKLQKKAELGNLGLKLLFHKKQAYIIQLLNERELVVREAHLSLSLSSSNAANIGFEGLTAGTYKVKIIFDDNDNGKWDSGNYLSKKQPERVLISSKQIKVISDWDAEEEIQVK